MNRIGIPTLAEYNFDSLKKDFLFFDQIMIDYELLHAKLKCQYDLISGYQSFYKDGDHVDVQRKLADLEFLISNDFVLDLNKNKLNDKVQEDLSSYNGDEKVLQFIDEFKNVVEKENVFKYEINNSIILDKNRQELIKIVGIYNALALKYGMWGLFGEEHVSTIMSSYILNNYDKENIYCPIFPFIKNSKKSEDYPNTLSIILNLFPLPELNVSWEELKIFRDDEESKRKFRAFKNWIQKISKSNLPQKEISEELEYLLEEYKTILKLHNLKYNLGNFELITMTTVETLENLITLKWSKAIKSVFELKRRNIDFLIGEAKAPGREVAYLNKIDSTFNVKGKG